MKKILFLILILLLSACSLNAKVSYTNLSDENSKQEVVELFKDNGINQQQIQQLLNWVDDYNSRVAENQLAGEYKIMKQANVDYSNLNLELRFLPNEEIVPEVNCRLTSFLLFKNNVETNGKKIEEDTFLIFDLEAINDFDQFKLNDREVDKFTNLFNWVSVKDLKTIDKHIEAIEKSWQDREIKIKNPNISLINVYMHSLLEDVRFIGHTGVLFQKDNTLYFVEKYGPLYPFQVTKFNNRSELKKYLLSRPDIIPEKDELEVLVFENNKVLR